MNKTNRPAMPNQQLPNSPNSQQPPAPQQPTWLTPGVKLLLSIVLAVHVLAVFVGPWAMPPQGSDLARTMSAGLQPYIQALSLNNGYRFFAPEPGPGHLVRYEITTRDGQEIEGVFPDLKTEWPRLLYHRHFMLSEFINALHQVESNKVASELATAYGESYVNHLRDKYNAKSVKLYLLQHALPSMADVRGGKKLSDPSLLEEKLLVEYED